MSNNIKFIKAKNSMKKFEKKYYHGPRKRDKGNAIKSKVSVRKPAILCEIYFKILNNIKA